MNKMIVIQAMKLLMFQTLVKKSLIKSLRIQILIGLSLYRHKLREEKMFLVKKYWKQSADL